MNSVLSAASTPRLPTTGNWIFFFWFSYMLTGDNGEPGPAIVWRYLTTRPLKPAVGVTIVADPADPLKATIKGKILVEVRYGGKAEVNELHLDRPAANVEWTVAFDDVEAMAKSIGLGDLPPPVPPLPPSPPPAQPQSAAPVWLWPAGAQSWRALYIAIRILGRNSDDE